MPREVEAGQTIFVQACARMMSAAWIKCQMEETSTAPRANLSGIAYSMRFTIASDIGMAFELGLKSVAQGLSPNPDGQPQVLNSHELHSVLWRSIPPQVRQEIDDDAEWGVCGMFGADNAGKVLPFSDYVRKHADFLDRTVDNRYAIPGDSQWKSDHRFILGDRWLPGYVFSETNAGNTCVDGLGILLAYWWAIMKKACGLRWEDARCEADKELAADRDEAWALVDRATGQMFGNIKVLSRQGLEKKR
ncbi:MAG: hypothetical protein OXH52_08035 [Gammaproteobacteria bacterium]|nr:hypothetical protein [Gammaproteobacteria bacterium]